MGNLDNREQTVHNPQPTTYIRPSTNNKHLNSDSWKGLAKIKFKILIPIPIPSQSQLSRPNLMVNIVNIINIALEKESKSSPLPTYRNSFPVDSEVFSRLGASSQPIGATTKNSWSCDQWLIR